MSQRDIASKDINGNSRAISDILDGVEKALAAKQELADKDAMIRDMNSRLIAKDAEIERLTLENEKISKLRRLYEDNFYETIEEVLALYLE